MKAHQVSQTFDQLVDVHKLAFQQYVDQLPIANEFKQYLIDDEFIAKNPVMYLIYPQLFANLFTVQSADSIKNLCIAGYLYYRSLIENDALLDTNEVLPKKHIFTVVSSIAQEESIKLLCTLFDLKSDFWKVWNKRKTEYIQAMRMEKNPKSFISRNSFVTDHPDERRFQNELSLTDYERLADYKSAFGKIAIDAVYLLGESGDRAVYERLLRSHTLFSIGFQIIDDISDFQQDYVSPQVNIAHAYLNTYCQQLGLVLEKKDVHLAQKYLYVSGVAVELLNLAIGYFDRALAQIEGLAVPLWNKVIIGKRSEVQHTIKQVTVYDKLIDLKLAFQNKPQRFPGFSVPMQPPTNLCHGLANKALTHLAAEWQTEFGEVKHIMYLSQEEGFSSKEEYHVGDVFQRALIADILCDANAFFGGNLRFMIDNEVRYLLDRRLTEGVSGWSYFPSVPEIAPDADDLGQLIQVLVKALGRSAALSHVSHPLHVLLTNNYDPVSGGIETWIVPNKDRTPLQDQQNRFNETKWGKGPDTEVVANLLQGLLLLDPVAYSGPLRQGAAYLIQQQKPAGNWASRWYYGPFYGTYVCLRLLSSADLHAPPEVLEKAFEFLVQRQQHDGGWGLDDKPSDPLSTALALLAICYAEPTAAYRQLVENGMDYLQHSQTANGHWKGVPFIAPRLNEPYRSTTLTSAYVLKAALACFQFLSTNGPTCGY